MILPPEWLELLSPEDAPRFLAHVANRQADLDERQLPHHLRFALWQTILGPSQHRRKEVSLRCRDCNRLLDKIRPASGGITSQKHGGGVAPLRTATLDTNRGASSMSYQCLGRRCKARWSVNIDKLGAAYIVAVRNDVTTLIPGAPRFGLPPLC